MAKEEELIVEEVAQKAVKKKDRRSITSAMNSPGADVLAGTGENARYLAFILAQDNLPKINTGDPKQVQERVNWYFNYCMENDMKPTASGLASAIGVSRNALWKWKQGIDRPKNYPIVEAAYNRLEELWEMYMMNGKINPASGIFLGKNQFDYKDVQDVVVTPNNPLGEAKSAEEIAQQYEYLPEE